LIKKNLQLKIVLLKEKISTFYLLFYGNIYMKNPYLLFTAAMLLAGSLSAATTATQAVTMQIASTSSITASGNPATLAVTLDSDGQGSASDNSTTYTIVSNASSRETLKITGAITTGGDMPEDTTLTITLASNDGKSKGALALGTSAVELVEKIPALVSDTASITYDFSVTNGWEVPTQTISRTVTLTLMSS
jgi:hypothetical protein